MEETQVATGTILASQPDYLPARTLCEFVFCPRAGYIEWVQVDNADNYYTLEGSFGHKRVDAGKGKLPEKYNRSSETTAQSDPLAEKQEELQPIVEKSLLLSSEKLRLIAKIDMVEIIHGHAIPIEFKRGRKPDIPEGVYKPTRIQLAAHALLLQEHGYRCDKAMVYYIESKEKVTIDIDQELISQTLNLANDFFLVAKSGHMPAPLSDSSKCDGCSLAAICLPDELGMLSSDEKTGRKEPRRLIPARDDAMPVYVQVQGGYISKSGDILVIKEKGVKTAEAKLFETSQLVVFGNAQVTTQTLQELFRRGIPVVYCSTGGWFYGMATGPMNKNIDLRLHQYKNVVNPFVSLELAKSFIKAKIRNSRTLLRRNADNDQSDVLQNLMDTAKDIDKAEDLQSLLGYEGMAAKAYFSAFESMLKKDVEGFRFDGRNRRPPRDPVNALLSLSYSLLVKDLTVTLQSVGFDPYLGFYHQPRYGRPSLALDLMEEFRPIIADSVVITTINNGIVSESDFIRAGNAANLKSPARKRFILAYERRMDQLIRHPVFGYQISYRRVLDVQCRLLARFVSGELKEYPSFMTR